MKSTHNYWWIGCIIGSLLGLLIVKEGPLTGILVGAFNGIFFGWLIGLIIKGNRNKTNIQTSSRKVPFKDKMDIQKISKVSLQSKYSELISLLLLSPGAKVTEETKDYVIINWSGISITGQFIILQLLDKVNITWKVKLPTGTIKESLEFPDTLDQQVISIKIEDDISRNLNDVNWNKEYHQIDTYLSKEFENTGKKSQSIDSKIIKPGEPYCGIVLNKTTGKEVIKKFGPNYVIDDYDYIKSFCLRYKSLGMGCIFEVNDPNQFIKCIELVEESRVKTLYGIDFEQNNTADKVFNLHGSLPDEKITEDEEYICLDYGEILFYFYKENSVTEIEDLRLSKIQLKVTQKRAKYAVEVDIEEV